MMHVNFLFKLNMAVSTPGNPCETAAVQLGEPPNKSQGSSRNMYFTYIFKQKESLSALELAAKLKHTEILSSLV